MAIDSLPRLADRAQHATTRACFRAPGAARHRRADCRAAEANAGSSRGQYDWLALPGLDRARHGPPRRAADDARLVQLGCGQRACDLADVGADDGGDDAAVGIADDPEIRATGP